MKSETRQSVAGGHVRRHMKVLSVQFAAIVQSPGTMYDGDIRRALETIGQGPKTVNSTDASDFLHERLARSLVWRRHRAHGPGPLRFRKLAQAIGVEQA